MAMPKKIHIIIIKEESGRFKAYFAHEPSCAGYSKDRTGAIQDLVYSKLHKLPIDLVDLTEEEED